MLPPLTFLCPRPHINISLFQFNSTLSTALGEQRAAVQHQLSAQVTAVHAELVARLEVAQDALAAHHDQLNEQAAQIAERATLEELDTKAAVSDHEALEVAVREGLRRRAAVRTVRGVQEDVTALQDKCAYLDKIASISQRFIEWFHNRGSAYEQNCVAIERQLNSLVVGSDPRPRARDPFTGQVRLDQTGADAAAEAAAADAARDLGGFLGDGEGGNSAADPGLVGAAAAAFS